MFISAVGLGCRCLGLGLCPHRAPQVPGIEYSDKLLTDTVGQHARQKEAQGGDVLRVQGQGG
jgi:hypothetical protein